MCFLKKVFNSFAWQFGKYLFFVLLLILFLILKGTGVLALESEQWTDGGLSSNLTDNVVLSSESEFSFSEYSSNYIRNFVYTQVNQTYYDSTLSEVEFYKQYNYVVYPISSSTIRIYIQDYNVLMDYQGLNPIEGADTKFFFWNIYCSTYVANITTHYLNIGVFYNMYIDLNYNTETFSWSSDSSLFDVYREYITSYATSGFPYSMNLKLYDSYNNNFAWVESFSSEWISQFNYNYKWRDIAQFSFGNISALYYYGLMDFPTLSNVATPPEDSEGGGGSDSDGIDISETNNLIQDLIDSGISNINSVLDEMKSIKEIIAGGFRDILETIRTWFNNFFNGLKELLISLFVPEDLSFLEDFKEEWEEKLGFIYEIIDLVSNFFNRLINSDWETWTSITFPEFKINDVTFWEEQEIDITEVVNVVKPYQIYTSLACVILCVNGCIRYYYRFFGGD